MTSERVELRGSHREAVAGARVGRRVDPDARIMVLVEVRRKAEPPKAPHPSQQITRAELAERFGASRQDMALVRKFAGAHNLHIVTESSGKRTFELAGTVADMSRAFGVTLNEARLDGVNFRQRRGSITIPAELEGVIVAVLGLDTREQAHPRSSLLKGFSTATGTTLTPLDVAKLYDFPTGLDGSGQTIAIIELGGGFSTADLNTYFTGLGLPVPSVAAVPVLGGSNAPGVDQGADTEVMLDIEVAGAIAPRAKQRVYFAPNTDAGFLAAVKAAIHDSVQPCVISISWGKAETTWSKQARDSMESAFQDAANLGIPVTVAAGDNGSVDGTSAVVTDFPAAAPHALGCGGTLLQGSGGTISSEVVWNAKKPMTAPGGGGATGGGISTAFPKPTYQNSVTVPASPVSGGGRGVPDVCGNAANDSPYFIRVSGADGGAYGTSAVAPLYAGLIALFAQKLGRPVGFLHTIFYQNATISSAFRDITSGDNDISGHGGPYQATTGWDPCTGLGSPRGKALLTALQGSVVPAPGPAPTPSPTPAPHPPAPAPHPPAPAPHPPTPAPHPPAPAPHPPTPAPHPPTPAPHPPTPAPHPPTPAPQPPVPAPPPSTPSTGSTGHAFSAWMPPPYPPYPIPAPPPLYAAPPPVRPPVEPVADYGPLPRLGRSPTLGVVGVVGLVVLGVVSVVGLTEKS